MVEGEGEVVKKICDEVKESYDKSQASKESGFFEENPGERSMMRLSCFMCVAWGLIICMMAAVAAFKGNGNWLNVFTVGMSIVGTGLAGKVAQKYME